MLTQGVLKLKLLSINSNVAKKDSKLFYFQTVSLVSSWTQELVWTNRRTDILKKGFLIG